MTDDGRGHGRGGASEAPAAHPRLSYVPGLDGMRALAVLAVMAVHNDFAWIPGGFYGVDLFFVLSGYLITSLLITEWRQRGSIALGSFWARRARRLLPALLLLVAVVGVVSTVWPSVLSSPQAGGTLASLFYSANWYFIAQHANYFVATAQPSPLLHTWSLAIEEQFYLVWPLVTLAILGGWRGRHRAGRVAGPHRRLTTLTAVAVAGALGSAVLMAVAAGNGTDTTRAYYGTDTRAQGVLVGAALACALARWGPSLRPRWRRAGGWLALAGAAGTAAMWGLVSETSPLAFRGGFLLVAGCAAAVVAGSLLAPRTVVPALLATRPLRALGRISYGVYLWYWPVLLAVTGARAHVSGYALFALRVAVTVAVAALSYRLVESPIRRGALPGRRALVAALGAGTLALAVPAALAIPLAGDTGAGLPASLVLRSSPAALPAHPLRVLLVGDSIAGSIGAGLGEAAPHYGVQLMNEGSPGCSASTVGLIRVLLFAPLPPGPPCRRGDPGALFARWRSWVRSYNPDVVLYVARSDILDQEVDGQWANAGQPPFDAYLLQRLHEAVGVLASRGAPVVLLTSPRYDSGEQPNGTPFPEDDPRRVQVDNSLLHQLAASTPGVSVFPFGTLLSPGGQFTSKVDGVTMRCGDGVHFTAAAGVWLAPHLFPRLLALGGHHHAVSPEGVWPGPAPPAVPSWWRQLPCG